MKLSPLTKQSIVKWEILFHCYFVDKNSFKSSQCSKLMGIFGSLLCILVLSRLLSHPGSTAKHDDIQVCWLFLGASVRVAEEALHH